jgi:transposase
LCPRTSPSTGLRKSTLEQVKVPRIGRGRPRFRLRRVIADRGYDSDPLRLRLKRRGTELIAPYQSNNRHRRSEDNRKLRPYHKHWKIERTNAWLQNFQRIQVRYDRILTLFHGFFHCACLLITLMTFMQLALNRASPEHYAKQPGYCSNLSIPVLHFASAMEGGLMDCYGSHDDVGHFL